MDNTDKPEQSVRSMNAIDWLEIEELIRGAEGALISGTLNDWQHASTTTFHVLATALVDIHNRLADLENESSESLDDWPDEREWPDEDFDDGQ